jgi:hypothetical protein
MRNRNRQYARHIRNVTRFVLLDNSRQVRRQSMSIITMKNPCKLTCVEKLLRLYERC